MYECEYMKSNVLFRFCLASVALIMAFIVSPTAFAKKQWTFMVYLDADNNLEEYGISDFLEMSSVGSDDNVDIVVQMDRIPKYDTSYGDWTDTRRGLVAKNDEPDTSWGESIGEANMGDGDTLKAFVNWAVENYPSDKYALILWNHGGGWRSRRENLLRALKSSRTSMDVRRVMSELNSVRGDPMDKFDHPPYKAICWDDTNDGDNLYTSEVQEALDAADQDVDLIGMDACLMAMVEVAHQFRSTGADVMAGSEATEPGAGWPYDTILENLVNASSSTAQELGSIIVEDYYRYYSGQTQSAVDLGLADELATLTKSFVETAVSSWQTNVDDVKSAATSLKQKTRDMVVAEKHGDNYSQSNGLSVYFPLDGPSDDYVTANVDFAGDAGWRSFLETYASTLRTSWLGTARLTCDTYCGEPYVDLYDFANKVATFSDPNLYSATSSVNQFTTTGTAQGWKSDDGAWEYSLPFTFTYYGTDYSSLWVSANGFLDLSEDGDLANSAYSGWNNTPANLLKYKVIAPLWYDLDTSSGDIYIEESNDSVLIRWEATSRLSGGAVNVEVTLYSAGGVEFSYGGGNADLIEYSTLYSPCVGLSAGDKGHYDFGEYTYLGSTSLTDADTLTFSPKEVTTYTLTMGASPTVAGTTDPESSATLTENEEKNIVATANDGYLFSSWSASPSENVAFGSAGATSATTTVTLTGDATVTAVFSEASKPVIALNSDSEHWSYDSGTGNYSLTLSIDYGETVPPETFQVFNGNPDTLLNYFISSGASWVKSSVSQGDSVSEDDKDPVVLTFATSQLAAGDHSASVRVACENATNSPILVQVALTVGSPQIPKGGLNVGLTAGDTQGITKTNNNQVSFWGDSSGLNHDAEQRKSKLQPTLVNTIAGKSVLYFNGGNLMTIEDSSTINSGGPYTERTIVIAFRTSFDITSRQMLFEQGDSKRGFNAYIEESQIKLNAWNLTNDGDSGTPWGPVTLTGNVTQESYQTLIFFYDQPNNMISALLNGVSLGEATGVGKLYGSKQGVAIGALDGSSYFQGRSRCGGFKGYICEFYYYDETLSDADTQSLLVNLADKFTKTFSAINQFDLWMTASKGTDVSDDEHEVASWSDNSFHHILFSQNSSKRKPWFDADLISNDNEAAGLIFDGNNDFLNTGNHEAINSSKAPYAEKTLFVVFQTGADIYSPQAVWSQGDKRSGLNVCVENGQVVLNAWNFRRRRGTVDWGGATLYASVDVNTPYCAQLELNQPASKFVGYLTKMKANETKTSLGKVVTVGKIPSHPPPSLGCVRSSSYGCNDGKRGAYFNGAIMEVIMYNDILTDAQVVEVDNYLNGKYIASQ